MVPFFVLSAALHLLLLWVVPSGRDTAGLKVQVLRLPPPVLVMPKPAFTADSPRLLQYRLERLELPAGPESPNPPESIPKVVGVGKLPVITPFAELAIDTSKGLSPELSPETSCLDDDIRGLRGRPRNTDAASDRAYGAKLS